MSTNKVDELMSLDPLDLTSGDLDEIVAYHRKNRGLAEQGIKPKKEQGPKVNLDAVMAKLVKPKAAEPAMTRRKVT